MANMRMLIRIVFVIFIAKGIDCLGGVCDNCCDNYCDCFKEKDEYEEIFTSAQTLAVKGISGTEQLTAMGA